MCGKEAKQRPSESGKRAPRKVATDTRISARPETGEAHDVDGSAAEAIEPFRQLTSEPVDLPASYGETRVVLLPVDPYQLHVYWEVTSDDLEKTKDRLDDKCGQAQAILRFYDITNMIFDGTNAHASIDVDVDMQERKWFGHLSSPAKSYLVDLGLKTEDGQLVPLVRSNRAETPPAGLAPKAEARYALVTDDDFFLGAASRPIDGPFRHERHAPNKPRPEGRGQGELYKNVRFPFRGAKHCRKAEPPPERAGRLHSSPQERECVRETKIFSPIDSARALPSGPPENPRIRIERSPVEKTEVAPSRSSHLRYKKRIPCDLAEMSEEGFIFGQSSK